VEYGFGEAVCAVPIIIWILEGLGTGVGSRKGCE
jgi:hypothetical protein